MSFASYLTTDIKVYRRSLSTANDFGEAAETWPLVATFKGSIHTKGGSYHREESGNMTEGTHKLFCLVEANVKVGDKVKDEANKEYGVIFIKDPANRGHHLEVDLREVS